MTPLGPGGVSRLRAALDAPDLDSDRYRVLGELARGGMGTVYRAEDRLLGRPVALKVLHLEDLSEEGAERMMREARILARLEHPGIVPIHDLGRLPDGRVFYAMKLVRGERLDRHAGGHLPVAERLRLFLKVCEAVAFAHAAGVLHRDLKPENVMVGEFGEVLVLDWGVAIWTGTAGSSKSASAPPGEPAHQVSGASSDTRPGPVLGTPAYMAPEQAGGDPARMDARTDVYGLGAMLAALLTGAPPGRGGPAVRPPALAAICARALASDPARRYPSVEDLAAEVRRFLGGARVLAHAEGVAERLGRFAYRHRVALGLVGAYLVLRGVMWLTIQR